MFSASLIVHEWICFDFWRKIAFIFFKIVWIHQHNWMVLFVSNSLSLSRSRIPYSIGLLWMRNSCSFSCRPDIPFTYHWIVSHRFLLQKYFASTRIHYSHGNERKEREDSNSICQSKLLLFASAESNQVALGVWRNRNRHVPIVTLRARRWQLRHA